MTMSPVLACSLALRLAYRALAVLPLLCQLCQGLSYPILAVWISPMSLRLVFNCMSAVAVNV